MDPAFIYVQCAIREKEGIKVIKSGQIIDFIEPRTWPGKAKISDNNQKRIAMFKLDLSLRAKIIQAVKPGTIFGKERARVSYFDFEELGILLGISNLKSDFEDENKIVPPIDGVLKIGGIHFKPSQDKIWP